MTGSFGDGDSVRGLGQALLQAAEALGSMTSDLSRHVTGLVPDGWSGNSAEKFGSDWSAKAQQADELAAVCNHVGRVLTQLADQIDGANQQAARAQQMNGGAASRLDGPASGQRSAQALSQATGAAEQARAAARAKLIGIQVPRFGRGMSVREVSSWASRLGQQPSMPGLEHFLHDAGTFTLGQLDGVRNTAEGVWDGYKQLADGLQAMGDVGSPAFAQTWEGMGRLFEVWNLPTMESAWGGLEKGLTAWDEWRTDPARAAGTMLFNIGSIALGGKALGMRGGTAATDTGEAAAGGARTAQAVREPPPLSQAERQTARAMYKQFREQATSTEEDDHGFDVGPGKLVIQTGETRQISEQLATAYRSDEGASRLRKMFDTLTENAGDLTDAGKANGTAFRDLLQPRHPPTGQPLTTVAHTPVDLYPYSTPDAISSVMISVLVLNKLAGALSISGLAARNVLLSALITDSAAAHGAEGARP